MKTAFIDCTGGISGNMMVGALIDAGLPLTELQKLLRTLALNAYRLSAKKVSRCGIAGTLFEVRAAKQPVRGLDHIVTMIEKSGLPAKVKENSIAVFKKLGAVESKIHRIAVSKVHFHEIGAADSIIDVVGAFIGMHVLGIETAYASPVNVGKGCVAIQHGILPVPAPATAELLKGVPIFSDERQGELTTPTGAAIVTQMAEKFDFRPTMQIITNGYGAGSRDVKEPNVLMLSIGHTASPSKTHQKLVQIETNIDDLNPQIYDYVMDRLFEIGVRDVFLSPIQMKKNRPGVLLTVLVERGQLPHAMEIIFKETSTIGIRYFDVQRSVLERTRKTVSTKYGSIRLKVSRLNGTTLNAAPEYDDCRKAAQKKRVPLKVVVEEALSRHQSENS